MKSHEHILVDMLVQRALDSYAIYGRDEETFHVALSKHPDASQEVMDAAVAKLKQHGFEVSIANGFDPEDDEARRLGPGRDQVPRWLYGDPGGDWDADLHGYIIHTRFPRFIAVINEIENQVKPLWFDQPTSDVNVNSLLQEAWDFYADFTDDTRNPSDADVK